MFLSLLRVREKGTCPLEQHRYPGEDREEEAGREDCAEVCALIRWPCQVFREPPAASQVDHVLSSFAKCIQVRGRGRWL